MRKEREYRPSNLIFVRHGESLWNKWGKENKRLGIPPPGMEGVPDHKTPLTAWGREQVRQTAKALFEKFGPPAVIYHSDYVRTTESADIIGGTMQECGADPIPLYRDFFLEEQRFGRLEAGVAKAVGMSEEEFLRLQAEFNARKSVEGKFYARPPDGDAWRDIARNTHAMLDKFFRPCWHGETLLVVSHAVTIATFLYHLHGRDQEATVDFYEEHGLDNCGVVHFRYNSESRWHWDLVCWNDILWKIK